MKAQAYKRVYTAGNISSSPSSFRVTSTAFHLQLLSSHSQNIITMLSKTVALLLFAAGAIAGPIAEGTYRIINVASQSSARVYSAGDPIYVSSTLENPGPFEVVSPCLDHSASNIDN
jgi:hypothetical protein